MTIKELIILLQRLEDKDRIVCMSQDAETCDEVLALAEPQGKGSLLATLVIAKATSTTLQTVRRCQDRG